MENDLVDLIVQLSRQEADNFAAVAAASGLSIEQWAVNRLRRERALHHDLQDRDLTLLEKSVLELAWQINQSRRVMGERKIGRPAT